MFSELLFGLLIFTLLFIILLCSAALPPQSATDAKDKTGYSISLTATRRLHLQYSTIRLIMLSTCALLILIDVTAAATRDASVIMDVPMCLVAVYLSRLLVFVELVASVLDFPLFLLGPVVAGSPRVRYIVWIGVFLVEHYVWEGVGMLFFGTPPAWLMEQSKWKGEMAVHWWNGE